MVDVLNVSTEFHLDKYHWYKDFRENFTFPLLSMGSISIFPFIYKTEQCPLLSIGNVQLILNCLFFC
jgi:hypothetical protein